MKVRSILITLALGLFISTQALAGNISVADVNNNMAKLAGQQITVTGKVVKVNNGIMRRNFVHIKDGTGSKGSDKLIITSQQTARVGDNVTITGTVVLGTDFGMGYSYPLLIEKSAITISK
jgi:hypothetical protein